jgi:hypothetical protein
LLLSFLQEINTKHITKNRQVNTVKFFLMDCVVFNGTVIITVHITVTIDMPV